MVKTVAVTRGRQLGALVAGFLHFDLSFMAWIMVGALGIFIARDFHLSAAQKGLLVAVPTLTGALARVPVGVLANRFGCRAMGFVTLACSGAALALAAGVGSSYLRMLGIGALLGISGASFAVALPLASHWFPPRRQGLALGLVGAGNSGTIIATFFAPRVATAIGWHGAFAVALVPIAVVTAVWFLLARDASGSPRRFQIPWQAGDLYALMAVYSLTFGGFVGLASFLPIYLHDQYRFAPVAAGTATTLIVLAGSLARPLGGLFADLLGGRRMLVGLFAVITLATLVASWLPAELGPSRTPVLVLAVLMAALGAGNGATFQMVPLRFGREVAAVTGVVGAAGGVGGFFLPNLMGSLKSLTGSYSTGLEVFAGAVLAVAAVVLVGYGRRWERTFLRRELPAAQLSQEAMA